MFANDRVISRLLDENDLPLMDYSMRNKALEGIGCKPLKVIKTGTTIVGITFKDGVILGADSRATSGDLVAEKYCMKLHKITDYIYACGAGTAADLDQVTRLIESNMRLLELKTYGKARVINAVTNAKHHLFNYMGHIGAYLIIGGVDMSGPHLYNVHAQGSAQSHQFVADGSGSMAAMSILEREYVLDMEEKAAVALLSKALMAGMQSDLSSGNTYTYAIIKKDAFADITTGVVPDFCVPVPKLLPFKMEPTGIDVLTKKVKDGMKDLSSLQLSVDNQESDLEKKESEKMDTSSYHMITAQ